MRRRPAALVAVVLGLALPAALLAQDRGPESVVRSAGRVLPGSYNSSPTAYGTTAGDIFFGAEYETKSRGSARPEGNVSFGFGAFDPAKVAGLEVSLTSLTTVNGFGDIVVGNVKAHKTFAGDLGFAAGVDGIELRNESSALPDPSFYAAVSKGMKFAGRTMFNEFTFGVGVGNGRFQQIDKIAAGDNGIGFFANASLRANRWSSLFVDYTGQDVNLGARIQPPGELPLVLSAVLYDLAGQGGDEVRVGLGAALILW